MAYSLTYTYGYDDFAALIRAKRLIGPLGRLGPATPYVVVSLLYLALVGASWVWDGYPLGEMLKADSLLYLLGGMVLVVALVALIDFIFMRGVYRLVYRRFALADSEITVNLDETGIKWRGNGLAGECVWSKVKRVVQTDDYLVLFISKVEGLFLPRRAVASDRDFQAIAAYVREHANG